MVKRISIEDSPEYDRFFAVQAFFNAISDSSFIAEVDSLTQGVGTCIDVVCCLFPGDVDPCDKEFDGVEFSLHDDEVVVDVPTFRRFLMMACESYVQAHPEDRAKITELLSRPQPPLSPPGTNVEPSRLGV